MSVIDKLLHPPSASTTVNRLVLGSLFPLKRQVTKGSGTPTTAHAQCTVLPETATLSSSGVVVNSGIAARNLICKPQRCRPQFSQLIRPATIHFSRCISRYSCHDTIHDTIRYITTKRLMSCSWAQKSVQLTSLVGSTHAFVVSAILNITLNNAQHGFFLSVCSAKIAEHKD